MNKPTWWTSQDTSGWDRLCEALHRDWDQTKFDLRVGGHELNQRITDTMAQATGHATLPASDAPNPPRVVGRWEDAEMALGFGYAARVHFGDRYGEWSYALEARLKSDWKADVPWADVRELVRQGYELVQ